MQYNTKTFLDLSLLKVNIAGNTISVLDDCFVVKADPKGKKVHLYHPLSGFFVDAL